MTTPKSIYNQSCSNSLNIAMVSEQTSLRFLHIHYYCNCKNVNSSTSHNGHSDERKNRYGAGGHPTKTMDIICLIATCVVFFARLLNKTGVKRRWRPSTWIYTWALVVPFSFLKYSQVALGVVEMKHFIDSNIMQANGDVIFNVLFKVNAIFL